MGPWMGHGLDTAQGTIGSGAVTAGTVPRRHPGRTPVSLRFCVWCVVHQLSSGCLCQVHRPWQGQARRWSRMGPVVSNVVGVDGTDWRRAEASSRGAREQESSTLQA